MIGYARVSTTEQNPDLQLDALRAAGCAMIYLDRGISGASRKRPELDACLAALREGQTLVVWKLDRLGRSLPHLVLLLEDLGARGIGCRSLTEAIDTGHAAGRLLLHMIGALAEFERALIVERTRAGQQAARSRGVLLGRRQALNREQIALGRELLEAGRPAAEVARLLGVARSTLYRTVIDYADLD